MDAKFKNQLEKEFGKGILVPGVDGHMFTDTPRISTGHIAMDIASGGGWPRGKIILVKGPECIDGPSFLAYETWTKDKTRRKCHKGGTIKRLYERFNKEKEITFYVKSMNSEGFIVRNEVLDVVKTSLKEAFEVVTSDGQKIVTGDEHKFATPKGFFALKDLSIGDAVLIHNSTRKKGRKHYPNRPNVMVKYHQNWPTKIVHDKKTGYDYLFYPGQLGRAYYEAFLNECSYDTYIKRLNTWSKGAIDRLKVLPKSLHVHHKDGDFRNNYISNLRLIDPSEHGKLHIKDRLKNLSFVAVSRRISSITSIGRREMYDLVCEYPYNNYVANEFIVHNSSSKTRLILGAMASLTQAGEEVVLLDDEGSYTADWAKSTGVDVSKVYVHRGAYAEETLDLFQVLVESGQFGGIFLDSVAALVPKDEKEASTEDWQMGLGARLWNKALRKIQAALNEGGKKKTVLPVVMVSNQLRKKIGVVFGNPETLPYGEGQKYFTQIIVDVRAEGITEDGIAKIRVKFEKNKTSPPRKVCGYSFYIEGENKGKLINSTWLVEQALVQGEIVNGGKGWWQIKGSDKNWREGDIRKHIAKDEKLCMLLIDIAFKSLPENFPRYKYDFTL